jgi:hypothetical protein
MSATSLPVFVAVGALLALSACNSRVAEEDCEPYVDDPGDAASFEVVIVNDRAVPIYIPPSGGCNGNIPLQISDASGPLTWREVYSTCEDLFTEGCAYPADCAGGPTVRIDPGGRYSTTWGRTRYELIEMPGGCFAQPAMCGPQCYQEQPAPDGTYTFSTRAGSEIAQCTDTPADCECVANADGWCEVWSVWEEATDVMDGVIMATLPADGTAEIIFD